MKLFIKKLIGKYWGYYCSECGSVKELMGWGEYKDSCTNLNCKKSHLPKISSMSTHRE